MTQCPAPRSGLPRAFLAVQCRGQRRCRTAMRRRGHRTVPLRVGAHGNSCRCTEDMTTLRNELLRASPGARTRGASRAGAPAESFEAQGMCCRQGQHASVTRLQQQFGTARQKGQRRCSRQRHAELPDAPCPPAGAGLAQQAAKTSNGHQPLVACQPIKVVGQFKCRGDGRLNDRRAARCAQVRDRRLDRGVCAQAASMKWEVPLCLPR